MEYKEFLISKKKLTAENPFSYCPYCRKSFTPTETITYKDVLPKLIYMKKMLKWNAPNGEHKTWEEVYFCEKCGRKDITDKDFIKFYGMDAEGNKYEK